MPGINASTDVKVKETTTNIAVAMIAISNGVISAYSWMSVSYSSITYAFLASVS